MQFKFIYFIQNKQTNNGNKIQKHSKVIKIKRKEEKKH